MKNKFLIFASLILCIASVFSFALIPKSNASAQTISFNDGDVVSIPSGCQLVVDIDNSTYGMSFVINEDLHDYLFSNKSIVTLKSCEVYPFPSGSSSYNEDDYSTFVLDIDIDLSYSNSISDYNYQYSVSGSSFFGYYFNYRPSKLILVNNNDFVVSSVVPFSSGGFLDYFHVSKFILLVDGVEYLSNSIPSWYFPSTLSVYKEDIYYNVNFVDYQGSLISSQAIQENNTVVVPEAPVREGYDFIGWTSNVDGVGITSPITQDVTFTATYKLKTYDVVIKDWDGSVLQSYSVNHGDTYTTDYIPTRTGYTFTGYVSDTGYELGGVVTNDIVLTATYQINQVSVVFYDFDNSVYDSFFIDYGSEIEIPEPYREGYTFSGWLSNVDGITYYDKITCDIEFTAQYQIDVYTIILKDESGNIIETQSVDYMSLIQLPDIDKMGYSSIWTSEKENESIFLPVTCDNTYILSYKINQYSMFFYDLNYYQTDKECIEIKLDYNTNLFTYFSNNYTDKPMYNSDDWYMYYLYFFDDLDTGFDLRIINQNGEIFENNVQTFMPNHDIYVVKDYQFNCSFNVYHKNKLKVSFEEIIRTNYRSYISTSTIEILNVDISDYVDFSKVGYNVDYEIESLFSQVGASSYFEFNFFMPYLYQTSDYDLEVDIIYYPILYKVYFVYYYADLYRVFDLNIYYDSYYNEPYFEHPYFEAFHDGLIIKGWDRIEAPFEHPGDYIDGNFVVIEQNVSFPVKCDGVTYYNADVYLQSEELSDVEFSVSDLYMDLWDSSYGDGDDDDIKGGKLAKILVNAFTFIPKIFYNLLIWLLFESPIFSDLLNIVTGGALKLLVFNGQKLLLLSSIEFIGSISLSLLLIYFGLKWFL